MRWHEAQEYEKAFWKKCDPKRVDCYKKNISKQKKKLTFCGKTFSGTGKKILEIGGGPFPLNFLTSGTRFTIDPLCEYYKKINPYYADNCTPVGGVAENLPFKKNVFDFILCFNALDHMKSPQKALSEIYRVLKKKGNMLLSVTTYKQGAIPKMLARLKIGHFKGHPHCFTQKEVETIVRSAGFRIEKKEQRSDTTKNYTYHSFRRKLFSVIDKRSMTCIIAQKP